MSQPTETGLADARLWRNPEMTEIGITVRVKRFCAQRYIVVAITAKEKKREEDGFEKEDAHSFLF